MSDTPPPMLTAYVHHLAATLNPDDRDAYANALHATTTVHPTEAVCLLLWGSTTTSREALALALVNTARAYAVTWAHDQQAQAFAAQLPDTLEGLSTPDGPQ